MSLIQASLLEAVAIAIKNNMYIFRKGKRIRRTKKGNVKTTKISMTSWVNVLL